MQHRELGDTGIRVSALGLGAGGASRLGLRNGATTDAAVGVVREAMDLGINYVDTAPAYGTEEAVGRALSGVPREELVVSTKVRHRTDDDRLISPDELAQSLDESLRRLGTDHVDVFFLHGVRLDEYDHCFEVLGPELDRQRSSGKVRAIGVTESFAHDPEHVMQHRALDDELWDVVLTGFNVLNPNARSLLPRAATGGVGVVVMHAVRWLLTGGERLLDGLQELAQRPTDGVSPDRLRQAIDRVPARVSDRLLPAAAYRFALDEPGFSSVLIGTGNPVHLRENVAAIEEVASDPATADLLAALDGLLEGAGAGSGDRLG